MTPKETIRSSRKAQQFHSSSKPGMHEPPPLSPRDWLGAMAGWHRSIERDDFSNADLLSARLTKIFFRRCVFAGADLRQADLSNSYFSRSDFGDADLTGANITHAQFRECDFTGTKLDHVALDTAEFISCTGLAPA